MLHPNTRVPIDDGQRLVAQAVASEVLQRSSGYPDTLGRAGTFGRACENRSARALRLVGWVTGFPDQPFCAAIRPIAAPL